MEKSFVHCDANPSKKLAALHILIALDVHDEAIRILHQARLRRVRGGLEVGLFALALSRCQTGAMGTLCCVRAKRSVCGVRSDVLDFPGFAW